MDANWIQETEVPPPPDPWHPADQVRRYLSALFDSSEYVGICTVSYSTPEGFKPTKGLYGKTQGELMEALTKFGDDIGAALGDYKPAVGAWIRFNPLDGKGVTDANVSSYRYALIESDSLPIPRQYAIIKELRLPVRIMVHSGGKSLHAIVTIDAGTYDEYRKRVDYLYKICQESGLEVDRQNRNPSRLSRLPGVIRGENKQYIVAEKMGCATWDEWVDYVQGVNDDLPEFECFGDMDELPPLQPELIAGILRLGHKMLITGPSKAGKSYMLIELAIAIAEGKPWLGCQCRQGRVLYINLEIARASCLDRVARVYSALDITERSRNLDIWNLRGASCPLDELTPKLIRRARDRKYSAIIIDPLYKVITGDENSAEDMAKFCNFFDRIARQLDCSVIYCHHHSKGAQGAKKAIDRSSGSGVFGRDPDAILDMVQLIVKKDKIDNIILAQKDPIITSALNANHPGWLKEGEELNTVQKEIRAGELLQEDSLNEMKARLKSIDIAYEHATAWRIETTLREFPPMNDICAWFRFPIHDLDTTGVLNDLRAEGERPSPAEARAEKQEQKQESDKAMKEAYLKAFNNANFGEPPTREQMAEYLKCSVKTVIRNMGKAGLWFDKNAKVVKARDTDTTE